MKKNIFSQLKEEHELIKDKFSEADNAKPAKRKELLEEIEELLVPHARGEEKTIYSVLSNHVKANNNKSDLDLVNEAYEEHRAADQLMSDLKKIDVKDEKWSAHLKVLKENIEHHIKEEENELFSKAREYLTPNELTELLPIYLESKESYQDSLPLQSQIKERTASPKLDSFTH